LTVYFTFPDIVVSLFPEKVVIFLIWLTTFLKRLTKMKAQ